MELSFLHGNLITVMVELGTVGFQALTIRLYLLLKAVRMKRRHSFSVEFPF